MGGLKLGGLKPGGLKPGRLTLAVGAVLLLAACTPMQWARPGSGLAELRADDAECRELAWRESYRMELYRDPFHFYPRYPARSRFSPFPQSPMSHLDRERHYHEFCLRARGWRLVPVAPGG